MRSAPSWRSCCRRPLRRVLQPKSHSKKRYQVDEHLARQEGQPDPQAQQRSASRSDCLMEREQRHERCDDVREEPHRLARDGAVPERRSEQERAEQPRPRTPRAVQPGEDSTRDPRCEECEDERHRSIGRLLVPDERHGWQNYQRRQRWKRDIPAALAQAQVLQRTGDIEVAIEPGLRLDAVEVRARIRFSSGAERHDHKHQRDEAGSANGHHQLVRSSEQAWHGSRKVSA